MSLLQYSEIKEKKVIIWKDEPFIVLESHVARTQQRKPQNQVKMRSLINGRAVDETFRSSDTAEEADIEKKEVKFIYENKGEFWFCEPNDPAKRFTIDSKIIGEKAKFLKTNLILHTQIFDYDDEEKIIGVDLPIKMEFTIKEAPPNIKGDTATGGTKTVVLENDMNLNVPLFIEAGEKIIVNTETGMYVERARS